MLDNKLLRFLSLPQISVVLIGILALIASATVGFLHGIPIPQVHDEFSYLLAADTFARGRLTNPAHPMWVHFETIQVIQQPSYMSRYMPGQGLFLALGKIITGYPIVGVWFSMAFMCASITWMLRAWVPNRWALLGGIFALLHPNFGVGNYWAQSYWGGAVSAGGGALLIGGVRHLMSNPKKCHALLTSVGLVILANSRPYEGFVLSISVGVTLLCYLTAKWRSVTPAPDLRELVSIFAIVGIIAASAMAYYNYRVTGNPGEFPYLVYEKSYSVSALLRWQQPNPKPTYHHKVMEDFHTKFELPFYIAKQSLLGFVKINLATLAMYFLVAANLFVIPMIISARELVLWSWQNIWGRCAVFIYIIFAIGMMIPNYSLPHYWAPVTGLNHLFVIQSIRFWRIRDLRSGQWVVHVLFLLALLLLGITMYRSISAYDGLSQPVQRAKLLEKLEQGKDRHLILVKYRPSQNHFADFEWVYNEADIDAAKVVWSRDMELAKNCELINYFNERVIWTLEIDRDRGSTELKRFPSQVCS